MLTIFVEATLTNFREGLCRGNKKNKIRMNDDTIRKRLRVYVPIARETYLYEKIGDRLKDYYSKCYHNPGSGM